MKLQVFTPSVFFLLFCLLLPREAFLQADTLAQEKPVIVAGSEIDYSPYCMLDENGEPTGMAVELFKAAAEAMAMEVTFVTGTWDSVKNLLKTGEIDALPLGRTSQREDIFDFTFPYLTMHGSLVVRAGEEGINTIEDIRGKDVAVMKGDNAEEFLREKNYGCRIHTTTTFSEALRQLAAGNYDAVVMQRLLALQLIGEEKLGDQLKLTGSSLEEFPQHFTFAVKEGNKELLSKLNEGLAVVMRDGTFHRIRSKWFMPSSHFALQNRRIIVAGDFNYPPYDYVDDNGQPSGFNTALTKAIAREMNLTIEIKLMPWHEARTKLLEEKVDAIQGMYYSVERDNVFDLSLGFLQVRHVIVAQEGKSAPQSLSDLKGLTVAVQQGDIMHDLALEQGLTDNLITAISQDEALERVSRGEADAALVAQVQAYYWMNKMDIDNLTITSEQPVHVSDYCYAVPQGDEELLALFTEGLSILKAKGIYHEIYDQWLGQYQEKRYTWNEIARYAFYFLVPALLLLLIILLWNRMLRKKVHKKTLSLQQEMAERKRLDEELYSRNYEIAEQNEELTTLNEELRQSNESLEEAVAKARESEEKFKNLARSTPAGIMLYQDDQWVYVNEAATMITGYSQKELLEMNFWEIVHPDYREMIKEKGLLRQQNIDVKASYEIVILDKSGKHRWINLSAASTYYQGKPAGIISAIEITEQKRTEQQLRESLREIERITASVPNVIWKAEVDKQGNMSDIYISEVVDELLALPAGTINHNWNAFFSYVKPEYIPDIETTMAGALKTPGKVIQKEYEVVKANGEEAWFLTAGKAFAGEETVKMYGYTVDITERVRAEEALKEMNVNLEQAKQKAEEGDRLKTAFLLNISHEIRTPMNAIKGFADILAEELADPEQQREASIILSNADQLLNVIDDMLLLSRLQAEKMALSAWRFSIKDFMAELLSTHQYLFENKKVTLSKKLSDALVNKMMVTDKDKLQRILSELITNAVKYTPEGSVVVGAEEEGPKKIRFYVEDSGLGITEKDRAFIFQRFYRAEEVQRKAIRGTGLGLSIVNYLVELMGGTISVVSSPGKGSRFSLTIPVLAHTETEEESRSADVDYNDIFSDLRVLVVEDEEDNYLLMNALLSRKVKKIEQAYDGHETLEKLKNQKYDMLLMDVKLPDMSGLKLVGMVKDRYPHLKVIALTAYALPEDRINALAAGCDGYISKPVDKNILYAKMAEVMKQG